MRRDLTGGKNVKYGLKVLQPAMALSGRVAIHPPENQEAVEMGIIDLSSFIDALRLF